MSAPQRKRVVVSRVPWWGRLEVRVIAALVVLGIGCVGASAYLVQLAIAYFEVEVESSLAEGEAVASSIEPFYHDLVDAQISAFEARGEAMAWQLALEATDDEGERTQRLHTLIEANPDVGALAWSSAQADLVEARRQDAASEGTHEWYEVVAPLPKGSGTLEVQFAIDPAIDARYQRLGEQKRRIEAVRSSQQEMEDAVGKVLGAASVVVLALALLAGIVVARTTTRKATELSRAMTKVGRGNLAVRVRALGRDELGQLASVFNQMLDELQAAQDKVAYLQRIGAWQEMARRIAHEIKNPLTPIALAVAQLRDKDPGLSPDFSRLLAMSTEIVEDEIAALRRMVTAFSQFARVPEVRPERVGVARILAEFERAYGHLTEQDDDRLRVEDRTAGAEIDGDRQLLKQVLVNLVENAVLSVREAGSGPVRVDVVAEVDGDWVQIVVDDNGPGIDDSRLERVFEPYETSREHGTGLGLAIVKKIILDHGGEVRAEHSPLGGARLVVVLPRASTPR